MIFELKIVNCNLGVVRLLEGKGLIVKKAAPFGQPFAFSDYLIFYFFQSQKPAPAISKRIIIELMVATH